MCGIAGLSFGAGVDLDPTPIARLLLAGLAERGQDATGYAYHDPDGRVVVCKESMRLAAFMERLELPPDSRTTIMHVRDFTKGRPGINDNNHPIRYGSVVGVHNGHIDNDDDLFAEHGKARSTPLISVDSEAIMMLADAYGDAGRALEQVHGSAAIAVLHDGEPARLTLAKRVSRTLYVAAGDDIALFASTPEPLHLACQATGHRLELEEIGDGTLLEIRAGRVAERREFWVDRRYTGRAIVTYPPIPEKPALVRRAMAAFLTD